MLICGLVVGILALVVGPVALAGAATTTPSSTSGPASTASSSSPSSFICASGTNQASASADSYLPINRWSGATSTQHSRLSLNLFNIGNLPDVVQRDFVVADAQALGNTFWKAGVGLTEAATRFCFADSVASTADGLTATIGKALTNGGLIAVVLVAAAILILVRLRRGDGTARHQIVKIVVVLLVLAVMVNGAEQTHTDSNGQVSFGFGSPGWVLTHVYDAVSTVASAPAAALSGVADNLSFEGATQQKIDAEDPLACGNYVNNLRSDYRAAYGSSGTSNMAATVPLALDSMWEQSGLTTYAYSQFGASNDYAPLVYCRLLEANANVTPAEQVAITDQTPAAASILSGSKDPGGPNTALAWASDQNLGASPNDTTDESMVGWAACQTDSPSFTPMEWSSSTGDPVTSQWSQVVNTGAQTSSYGGAGTVTPSLCQAFFDKPFNGFGPQGTAFEWPDNPTQISTAANPGNGSSYPGFADYVDTLHGTSNGPAEMLSIMFLISSTVDLVVFGLMAGAVLVAKFSLLFLMAFAAFFLLLSLWPGAAASSRLAGLAKHAFSMVLFVTGAQIILSIVAITTSIIMDTGTAVAGAGSFLSLLWMGIAPIAAIFIVHHLFKQVLKAPSPFKLSSAMAWGAAAGGVGAGVASGLDRIANRRAAWGTTKRAVGAARAPLARHLQRRQSMAPVGAGSQAGLGPGSASQVTSGGGAPAASAAGGKAQVTSGSGTTVTGGAGGKTPAPAAVGASAAAAPTTSAATSGTAASHSRPAGALQVEADATSRSVPAAGGGGHGPAERAGTMIGADPSEPAGAGHPAGAAPVDAKSDPGDVETEAESAGERAEIANLAASSVAAASVANRRRQRRRGARSQQQRVTGGDGAAGAGTGLGTHVTSLQGMTAAGAYASALGYLATRRRGWQLDEHGVLRTGSGRVVGGPVPNVHGRVTEADTRSAAERHADDRLLRKAERAAGRSLDRQALAGRASHNAINRFASAHESSRLGRAAGSLGDANRGHGRTIQRVAERTQRAAADFRAKPLHRQVGSVAKVGAMGVAAMALAAAPPALGVAAGAYALRRAHKAAYGLDALHERSQRHAATFKEAAAAERARRHETARSAAIERAGNTRQEPTGQPTSGGDGAARDTAAVPPQPVGRSREVANSPSADEPPPRDAPYDLDEALGEWEPDADPAPARLAPAGPSLPSPPRHRQPGGVGRALGHQAPRSAAEVLRQDSARPPAVGELSAEPDEAPIDRPVPNERRRPSHLVGNRRPNQPSASDEVPPEVRAHFDETDQVDLDDEWLGET